MTVPIDLQSQLPPPSDDEPQELRSDIVDELADHLQCLVIKEQLKAGGDRLTQAEVWQRVIKRFGNPTKVARNLWFQAIGRKLMLQKLALGLNLCVTLAACVGAMVVCYSLQSSVTQMSERVLQLHSLQANVQTQQAQLNKLSTLLERLETSGMPAVGGAITGDVPAGMGGGEGAGGSRGMMVTGEAMPGPPGMGPDQRARDRELGYYEVLPDPATIAANRRLVPVRRAQDFFPGLDLEPGESRNEQLSASSKSGRTMGIPGSGFSPAAQLGIPKDQIRREMKTVIGVSTPLAVDVSVITFELVHQVSGRSGIREEPDTTSTVSVEPIGIGIVHLHPEEIVAKPKVVNVPKEELRTAILDGVGRYHVKVTTEKGLEYTMQISVLAGQPKREVIRIVTPHLENIKPDVAAVKFKLGDHPKQPTTSSYRFSAAALRQLERPGATIDGRTWRLPPTGFDCTLTVDTDGTISGYATRGMAGQAYMGATLTKEDPFVFLEKTTYECVLHFQTGNDVVPTSLRAYFTVTEDQQEVVLNFEEGDDATGMRGPSVSIPMSEATGIGVKLPVSTGVESMISPPFENSESITRTFLDPAATATNGGRIAADEAESGSANYGLPNGTSVIRFNLVHAKVAADGSMVKGEPDTSSVVSVEPVGDGVVKMHAPTAGQETVRGPVKKELLRTAMIGGAGRFNVVVTTKEGLKSTKPVVLFAGAAKNEEMTILTPTAAPSVKLLEPVAVKFRLGRKPVQSLDPRACIITLSRSVPPSLTLDDRKWEPEKSKNRPLSLDFDFDGNIVGFRQFDQRGAQQSSSQLTKDDPWIFLEKTLYKAQLTDGRVLGEHSFLVDRDQQEVVLDFAGEEKNEFPGNPAGVIYDKVE